MTMAKQNWKDSTVFIGDNLKVMQEMNSGHIDLIYLDPPFNSNHNYAAPIGSKAAGAEFKDTWTLQDVDLVWHGYLADKHPSLYALIKAVGEVHGDSMKSYLIYMAMRILEMRRLLKPTGSIYLHCDPTAGHYLKLTMDAVFGVKNFRNEIVWAYGKSARGAKAISKNFARNHDHIFLYAKNQKHFIHNPVRRFIEYSMNDLPPHIRKDSDGRYFKTAPRGDYTDVSIEKLRTQGRIHETRTGNIRIKYFLETKGNKVLESATVGSVWDIPDMMHFKKERVGYPTQKPSKLLERIIEVSSNEGDIVFDPFCGCSTTLIAAQESNRKWVGCDISPKAGELIRLRIESQLLMYYKGEVTNNPPTRSPGDRTEDELFPDVKQLPYNHPTTKQFLFGKQEERCNGCLEIFRFKTFEVDHIVPRSKGGEDHMDNLQLLCPNCNKRKGDKDMKIFAEMMLREKEEAYGRQADELERMRQLHRGE